MVRRLIAENIDPRALILTEVRSMRLIHSSRVDNFAINLLNIHYTLYRMVFLKLSQREGSIRLPGK